MSSPDPFIPTAAYRDLVGGTEAGILFPLNDAAAAAAAIRRLADDPHIRHAMGQWGREHVQRYTPQRIVPQLQAHFRSRA